MLEIVKYNRDDYEFPALIVLGCFDGLHVGHAALLKSAKLQSKINGLDLGIMTFTDGKGGRQIYTFEERLELLQQFNAKFVLQIDFNEEFKATQPIDFLNAIEEKINVKAYMSGKDFRFGAGAKGKASTLKKFAEDEENGVWYMSVKDVMVGDKKVSASDIKALLESGEITAANELLGRHYSLSAQVIEGASRGKSLLGFPTMNMRYPENKVEVKKGVYAVIGTVGENSYKGIANYGARPTFGEEEPILEVHLDGFSEDVYGETVKVEFTKYLRDIKTFDCEEDLKAQLEQDLQRALSNEEEPAEAEVLPAEPAPVAEEAEAVAETAVTEAVEEVTEEVEAVEAETVEEVTEEPAVEEVEAVEEEQPAETVAVEEEQPAEELSTEEIQPVEATEEAAEEAEAVEEVAEEVAEEVSEELSTEEIRPVEAVEEPEEAEEPALEENAEPAEEPEETETIETEETQPAEEPEEAEPAEADTADGEEDGEQSDGNTEINGD